MALKVKIDLKLAQEIIDKLEKEKPWPSLTPFLHAVSVAYHTQSGTLIDYQVFRLRASAGLLRISVRPGKRGRTKGQTISVSQAKAMANGREKANKNNSKVLSEANQIAIEQLRKNYDKKFRLLVEKGIKGSPKSLIHLHCVECVGGPDNNPGAVDAIRYCQVYRCPLYILRPYQKKAIENES